ncbi:hypothetical protein Ddye_006229 [Dipteronia dyeriana]|uniref:Uncharacterized protein n=1 Tax=Dipteronia dyeriana TaxID=168575 RepID=A0AAE0CQJ1_9ROSI|nr:hypothetical protein Ddye_006229 [Dipteronia dyeriana]
MATDEVTQSSGGTEQRNGDVCSGAEEKSRRSCDCVRDKCEVHASSLSAPPIAPPPPPFPPNFMATLPPSQLPFVQQVQDFAKTYLPIYLARINDQGCHHQLANPTKTFLDPFISPHFYYYSKQVLWFLWCLLVLHHHAIVFPLQALYGFVQNPTSHGLQTFLQWFNPLSVWRTDLTRLMGQYHLWKMNPEPAAKPALQAQSTDLAPLDLQYQLRMGYYVRLRTAVPDRYPDSSPQFPL